MALDKSGKMKLFQDITGWSRDRMRLNEKAINAICGDGTAITYDEQNLTEEQKAQARENINAASNNDVEQIIKELNGFDTSSWVEATPIYEEDNLCIAVEDDTNRIGAARANGYNIAKYEIPENTKVRFSAAKPVPPSGNNRTIYAIRISVNDMYGSGVPIGPTDNKEGYLIEREVNVTTASYITISGNSTIPPKLEIFTQIHTKGIKERIEDLEEAINQNNNNNNTGGNNPVIGVDIPAE